jgi:hypothetical protein
MEADQIIDVAALDDPHRLALEEVIGRHLNANQRLVITVTEVDVQATDNERPPNRLTTGPRSTMD